MTFTRFLMVLTFSMSLSALAHAANPSLHVDDPKALDCNASNRAGEEVIAYQDEIIVQLTDCTGIGCEDEQPMVASPELAVRVCNALQSQAVLEGKSLDIDLVSGIATISDRPQLKSGQATKQLVEKRVASETHSDPAPKMTHSFTTARIVDRRSYCTPNGVNQAVMRLISQCQDSLGNSSSTNCNFSTIRNNCSCEGSTQFSTLNCSVVPTSF